MDFIKMEGLGNDFIVLVDVTPKPDQVAWWCDRRQGLGADGVLVVSRLESGPVRNGVLERRRQPGRDVRQRPPLCRPLRIRSEVD